MDLDGVEVRITKSLEAALLHIRSSTFVKALWIDQICINQHDEVEKSVQVQNMLRVYAEAERVYVWLGPSGENNSIGMMLLQQLCYDRQREGDPFWKELPPDMVRAGIEDIMSCAWFQRAWVVQEAAVGKKVVMHCGQHQFFWHNAVQRVRFFSRAIKMAILSPAWTQTSLRENSMEPFLQVLQLQLDGGPEKAIYKANRPPMDLLDIEMRHRVSRDPRDKIYSLLGFADAEIQQKLRPDYSMSVQDVFKQFEDVLLDKHPDVDLRDRYGAGQPRNEAHDMDHAMTTKHRDDRLDNWEIIDESPDSSSVQDGLSVVRRCFTTTRSAVKYGGSRMRRLWTSLGHQQSAEQLVRPRGNGRTTAEDFDSDLQLQQTGEDGSLISLSRLMQLAFSMEKPPVLLTQSNRGRNEIERFYC